MNKGFTLIELLAVILILGILTTIAVIGYTSYMENAEKSYYEDAEISMKGAMESLITYCGTSILATPDYCVNVPSSASFVSVSLSTLTENDFLDPILDQKTGSTCEGEVTVTNNTTAGSTNYKLEYKVCLRCNNYTSSECE